MRQSTKQILIVTSLALLLAPPVVQAVAPTLTWSRTIAGTRTELTTCGVGSGFGSTRLHNTAVDWATGDAFIAYINGDLTLVDRRQASNGALLWRATFEDAKPCGIALDQRGRLYVNLGPWAESQGVEGGPGPKVLRISDGVTIDQYTSAEVRQSGPANTHAMGVFVDTWTDLSDTQPKAAWLDGGAGFTITRPDSATTHTEVCTATSASALTDAFWANNGDGFLFIVDGNNVKKINPDTCATLATVAIGVSPSGNGGVSATDFDSLITFSPSGDDWFWEEYDYALTSTDSDTVDNGIYNSEVVYRALGFQDNSVVACVRQVGQDAQLLGYVASSITLDWVIDVAEPMGEGGIDCDYGDNGVLYWFYGQVGSSVVLRRYDGVYDQDITIPDQADLGAAGGGGGGGNPVAQARDFCTDAWGFDCGWLIIIASTGIVVVAFSRVTQATPVMAIGGLLGLGLGVILTGTDFVWLLFLVAFLLIGLAAKTMFGGGGDGGTE